MTPSFLIRRIRESDADALFELRTLAGPGFTSLAATDDILRARVANSAANYASKIERPGTDQRYMLVLEHVETRRVVGLAAVKACVGETPPFFNFRVLRIAQASAAAQRRFDTEVLILVNEFTSCSEVGSLFVRAENRAGGIGRSLAQARYLLMATAAQRFAPTVVSELRGVVDEQGRSPFWEHLGRHFFKMSFEEADRLSATTDNQFILDLMPKYPIYVDLLHEEARTVIGRCHTAGEGALRLLQWEGFRYDRVVDIFDAGPLLSAARDTLRTFREARRVEARIVNRVSGGARGLVATSDIARFRCCPTVVDVDGDVGTIGAAAAKVLGVGAGETLIVWSSQHAI
jgi:arginine N-succinyltransferase